jgi:hypothetical protein
LLFNFDNFGNFDCVVDNLFHFNEFFDLISHSDYLLDYNLVVDNLFFS